MKYKLEFLKDYCQKTGVTISLIITSFTALLLILALSCKVLEFSKFESIAVISLILEFGYGTVTSFLILRKREKYMHLTPFLVMNWLIGCFCLNTFIPVFQGLPIWIYFITFTFCISNFFLYGNTNRNLNSIIFMFLNGLSFWIIIYFTIYLLPFIPFSILGILALGMGFYGLVPGLVLMIHLFTIVQHLQKNKKHFISFGTGFLAVLLGFIIFTTTLVIENDKISKTIMVKSFNNNEDLPAYISVSQSLKPNFFNEILLKKNLVYVDIENYFSMAGFNSLGSKQFNEKKVHNPFISIAYLFCKDLGLSADDRINILQSNFDKRLQTEEQLWSGENLFTKNIKEDVKIYPDTRLAYTEITMNVACDKNSWRNHEAIYSFQLPEGSVATSLSLWVNGIERKGVLTTKEKAKKAYNQIVGVENRDPSLMQWREGNRVVVRVFPVNSETPRMFKCGFTTPLKAEDNKMKYESLSIKGPNISNAETISRIQFTDDTKIETSKDFTLKNGYYLNESKGLDNWQASMPLNKIKSDAFVWKNKIYEVKDIQKTAAPFTPSEIILDLNSNWTIKQIESFVNLNQKNLYVFINDKKEEINKDNFKTIKSNFENLQYSLLPLYKLNQNSLIITKSGTFSANFDELAESNYLNKIKAKTKDKNLKVINISPEINPFWQTIKEQKYVDYFQTTSENGLKMIKQHQFPLFKKEQNAVNIEPALISIYEKEKTDSLKSSGPNHIYRMYAFGKVLEEQVKIQGDSTATNQYVELAKEANIVTPISSLIVLGTDEDYKRTGIEKNVNTLGNASINNDGAVPEPHEWLLIIIAISFLYIYYRKSKKQIV